MAEYFAALPPDELAQKLISKARLWDTFISTSNHHEDMRRSMRMLFGKDDEGFTSSKVGQKGNRGQLSFIRPNHFRAVALNIHTLTTNQRPAMKPVARNTDTESQTQVLLASSQLDYFMTEKRVERNLKRAAWHAIGMGAGYVMGAWDSSLGNAITVDPDTGQPVKDGDLVFSNHLPQNVIFDITARDADTSWLIVRTWKNKFEEAAKFPERSDEILAISDTVSPELKRLDLFEYRASQESDLIPCYEFFHAKTTAVPNGRYMKALSGSVWLIDGDLPYRRVPVFRLSPDEVFDTPFGYSSLFGCLSMQQAVDAQSSIMLSNQKTLGAQVILARKGHGFEVSQITEAFSLAEHDCPAGQEPHAIQWTNTAPEIPEFRKELIAEMGTIGGGLNDVARGTEQRDLSGAAMALLDSQALRFNSGLQQSYTELAEDVGTFIIEALQDFAKSPRMAKIAGKAKAFMFRQYTGKDLSQISRVTIETSNPLLSTTSGKMTVADSLLQKNLLSAAQYLGLVDTGELEVMTEGPEAIRLNVKSENERLSMGQQCVVVPTDNHELHLKEHAAVWANPDVRENPVVYESVWAHIEMHMQVWRETDPGLLAALGMAPPIPLQPGQPPFAPIPGSAQDPGMTPIPPPGAQDMATPPAPGAPPSSSGPAPGRLEAPNQPPPGMPHQPQMPILPTTGQRYDPMGGPAQ